MYRLLRRRQDAQVDYTSAGRLHEYERSEIAVTGNEDTAMIVGNAKQLNVLRSGHVELSGSNHIVAQVSQETDRYGINILIGKEFHGERFYGAVARWISSAAKTSIAYCTQARRSASWRSG